MNRETNKEQISIVMPMRNSSTTVEKALASLEKQTYPIKEVIIVNDASEDNSLNVIACFSKKSKLTIRIITRKKRGGPGSTFNLGVKYAKSSLVILMHSDCSLPTNREIEKLIDPIKGKPSVVAAFPTIFVLESVWKTYDFWEKCFFSREVGKGVAGLATKFDCIRKNAYQKAGGFDMENFGVGGEDADLHERLRRIGKVVMSQAKVTHLHFLGEGFSFKDFLRKKRQYAMIYGRLLKKRPQSFLGKGIVLLLKPFLAILPFLPVVNTVGIPIIILYSFLYTKRMFITKSTLKDSRILILPFINILLIYCETFWTIESFLFGKNKLG